LRRQEQVRGERDDAGEEHRIVHARCGTRCGSGWATLHLRRARKAHSGLPMRSRSFLPCGTALLAGFLALPPYAMGQANDMAEVQVQMSEARRHFDALEYEQAVPALDRAVAILTTRRAADTQKILSDAYEMRARARFGLGDQNGAHDDFVALLKADPAHA